MTSERTDAQPERVEVTQADRKYAASIFIAPVNSRACLEGLRDDHDIVQDAARHRLLGVEQGRLTALAERPVEAGVPNDLRKAIRELRLADGACARNVAGADRRWDCTLAAVLAYEKAAAPPHPTADAMREVADEAAWNAWPSAQDWEERDAYRNGYFTAVSGSAW